MVQKFGARCPDECCCICSGELHREMHPDEGRTTTASIARANSQLAVSMLNQRARASHPLTDQLVEGKIVAFSVLPCGDPLFELKTTDEADETVWLHEVDVEDEEEAE